MTQSRGRTETVRRGLWVAGVLTSAAGLAWGQNAVPVPVSPNTVPGQPEQPQPAPGATPATTPSTSAPPPEPLPEGLAPDTVSFGDFAEPVELTTLVQMVARTLELNIVIKGTLTGTVVFNAPVDVSKDDLLNLLDALLEQHSYTVVLDPAGFYSVRPLNEVQINLGGDEPTTRIIPTPSIRPSSLRTAIESQFGGGGAANPGQPGQALPAPGGGRAIAYLDELGVIVMTDSLRRIVAVEGLVTTLLEEYRKSSFHRIEVKNVSSVVARERALALVGQAGGGNAAAANQNNQFRGGFPGNFNPGGEQPQTTGTRTASLDNLADRLAIDPTGNALIFRGRREEKDLVEGLIRQIDVVAGLEYRAYFAGTAAKQVASLAQSRGLGQVTTIEAPQTPNPNQPFFFGGFGQQQPTASTTFSGGPVIVVDEARGELLYYATPQLHTQMQSIITELRTDDDEIVLREYKLKHADAGSVAELVLGLLQNQTPVGSAPLLTGDTGGTGAASSRTGATNRLGSTNSAARRTNTASTGRVTPTTNAGGQTGSAIRASGRTAGQPGTVADVADDGTISLAGADDSFVIADVANNQVFVKAPRKLQSDFAKLIERIDLRRPQVYIQAQIISVSASKEQRLAFETQLLNAGGTGGLLQTNFGLSTANATGITGRRNVAPNLEGLTAAIVKSDQIPIIINALGTDIDGRIISSPQLLVNDNEEATIASIDRQPTTETNLGTGGAANTTTFGGYVDAGTNLTITPQI
jgi:type II secretory pathway component GspD/PulD (secretin)